MADPIQLLVDRVVREGKTPGIQYARVDDGGRIRTWCAGWAGIAEGRAMTDRTVLLAYSMSKIVTAELLSLLAREGQLSLDDPVSRFVPEQPYGPRVTLRHLLDHTAGIPNPIPLRWVHPVTAHGAFDEQSALSVVLRQHSARRSEPGTRRRYTNIGYWLAGLAAERACGMPFTAIATTRLLAPLGIGREEIGYELPGPEGRAHGYLEKYSLLNLVRPLLTDPGMAAGYEGRWLRIEDHYVNGPAFGGAVGTATGFCKLVRHLGRHGDARLGWTERGALVEKEGGGAGFHSLMRLCRVSQTGSVVMSNATGFDVHGFLDEAGPLSPDPA